jgi:hypothetical protein
MEMDLPSVKLQTIEGDMATLDISGMSVREIRELASFLVVAALEKEKKQMNIVKNVFAINYLDAIERTN